MKTPLNHCPKCKSENITADHMEYEFDCAWQIVRCEECDFEWQEVYKFDCAETCDTCKEIDEDGNIIPERDLWGNDHHHPRADWKYEVVNGDTNLGYWEWVENRLACDEDEKRINGSINL